MTRHKFNYLPFISLFLLFFLNACLGHKKTLYFQGDIVNIPAPNIPATYALRKGDVVKIKISNPDSESTEVLTPNTSSESSSSSVESAYFTDYYINDSGYVQLPIIGKIKIVGYTIMQVDSLVTSKAKDYFSFVTVEVKFASFKFLALGEFKSPGQYFVANETCTIYEALGIAGDVTEFANKSKAQLIRTAPDGRKTVYKFNLTDYSSFTQENYFVQPNDIIYVEPQKAKVDKQNAYYLTIGLAGASTLLLLLSRVGL